jgi:hypothetical protein
VTAAVELRSLVDEDLTDVDDEALVATVARYFREQEGVDVLRLPAPEGRRRLAEMCTQATGSDPLMKLPVGARDPAMRVLRAFCRARALALPLKHDSSGQARIAGLSQALRAAVEGARETRTLLVVSDMDPITDVQALRAAVAAVRHGKHRVTFVAPCGDDFVRAADVPGGVEPVDPARRAPPAQHRAVRELFVRDEAARLRDLRTMLGAMGVPLYTARARDPVARWLRLAAAPHA